MPFDASSYLRLDALHCIGTSRSGASFATSSGDILELSCFGEGVFRVRIGAQSRPDYGLLARRAEPCEVVQDAGKCALRSGDAVLDIGMAPLSFRLASSGGTVLTSITDLAMQGGTRLPAFGRVRQAGQWTAAFALGAREAVYGLGEKHGTLDKRGQLLHSWVQDARGVNTGLAHHEVPFAWSPGHGRGAWGVFVHTPGAVIHGIGHADWSHRTYVLVVDDEALDIFLIAARDPRTILARYADLVGRTRDVPLWSLGFGVGRMSYASPDDAAAAVARMRERKLPCDYALLDAGAVWDPHRGFDFEWDTPRWGDAATALRAIKAQNVRVCITESPYVSVQSPLFEKLAHEGHLLRSGYGAPYVFSGTFLPPVTSAGETTRAPDCGLLDFTHPVAYASWRDAHAALFAWGVDAIYGMGGEHVPEDAVAADGDRGVRVHNPYPVLYARCVQEAAMKADDGAGPPLVLARAGWAGSHRHAVHVAADAQRDWEGLAASIRGALSLGMSGVPLTCAQVPGTYGGAAPDAELCIRALQAAVFSSHFMARTTGDWEPWALGPDAEMAARKWLAFRYRLIPYLRATIEQAIATGMPVMRAMPLAFPGNPFLANYETQFMCGDALLIAPIVQAGGEADVALPPGAWFDVHSRQRVTGQRVVRYKAELDQFPIFGREGYALPLGHAVQHTGETAERPALSQLWLFGNATQFAGKFDQARFEEQNGRTVLRIAPELRIDRFGDGTVPEIVTAA